jgi:hypothetical protein
LTAFAMTLLSDNPVEFEKDDSAIEISETKTSLT